ncbi:hypothetical protein [Actinomadura verrucosospora]|uniref:DUF4333 domain-containing protein n=1 Tax=Actinomadura verrucosospora TaxID=46165 RepID=A0A7D3ZN70_ACTVE|nr:hypothetical protein [Actinomadura verrucosospora]QKG22502.1 hypothetical protein ACTIVE_4142 [Actinomadura verrucosospora]
MNRKKALLLGSAVLLVLVVAGGAAWLLVTSGGELSYKTQAALRKALPSKAADELTVRGLTLQSPLKCEDLPGWTKQRMRVSCSGTTADNKQVRVLGSGEESSKRNYFTILVDGRPVVENAQCLGASCHKKSG